MQVVDTQAGFEDLLPLIRSRGEEIEARRNLPGDIAEALRRSGIFSLSVPRAIGGREAEPTTILRTIETIATADGSTGWCAMIGIANNTSAGYLEDERGAREVWADPNAPTAGIAAPAGRAIREDGGVRVSGRWSFASGIAHCDWLWAGCMVHENGAPRMTPMGPEIIHVCVPVREATIHDTWFVSGLCGTGSNDFSIDDVFVPEQRIFDLLDPARHRAEPLFQMPPLGWFVSQVAAVSLGLGRGALDELIEQANARTPTMSRDVLADRAAAQLELARAEAELGAARAFLHATGDELWQTVSAGRQPTLKQRALNRVAAVGAARAGASAANTAHVLAGGSSIYRNSPLQRRMRDAEAILHHFTVSPHVMEDVGRILFGREPVTPVF